MKKVFLFMSTIVLSFGSIACSSDDNSTNGPEREVTVKPENYYKEIIGDWKMVKMQFLKADKSLVEEVDYNTLKGNCPLENWKFTQKENPDTDSAEKVLYNLSMHTYNANKDCTESKLDMRFTILENKFFFFYPDDFGGFVMNSFLFEKFTNKRITILSTIVYDVDSAKANKLPKGTVHIQYLFEK